MLPEGLMNRAILAENCEPDFQLDKGSAKDKDGEIEWRQFGAMSLLQAAKSKCKDELPNYATVTQANFQGK